MINVADVVVNFFDKSQLANNAIDKSKNGVNNEIMVINENNHKNLYPNLDDDDDDDSNTRNPFKMNKTLYDGDNNNPLNDKGYDH